jgi:hypothetical protein
VYNLPSLSSCILSGIVAALMAFGITCSPIDFLSGKQLTPPNPQVLGAYGSSTNYMDRSHKSDRLPMPRADPIASTSIIKKNADTPDNIVRIANLMPARLNTLGTADRKRSLAVALELPRDCEALASSLSDPILGRIAGRCFV